MPSYRVTLEGTEGDTSAIVELTEGEILALQNVTHVLNASADYDGPTMSIQEHITYDPYLPLYKQRRNR